MFALTSFSFDKYIYCFATERLRANRLSISINSVLIISRGCGTFRRSRELRVSSSSTYSWHVELGKQLVHSLRRRYTGSRVSVQFVGKVKRFNRGKKDYLATNFNVRAHNVSRDCLNYKTVFKIRFALKYAYLYNSRFIKYYCNARSYVT